MSSLIKQILNQLYFMGYCHYISYWEKRNEYMNDPKTKAIYQRNVLKEATLFPSLPIMVPALLLSMFLVQVYVDNPKLPMIFSLLTLMVIITLIFRKKYVTDDNTEKTLRRYENTSKRDRKKFKRRIIFIYIVMGAFFIFMIVVGARLTSILLK